ncbi:ketopantoate reductase PanE/ApbA C terminal-domain-containing protein [Trichophaea hybrida]|nr:ketopantoate reductase PanE/ApbA C terminal-domain-containing protein [Trichophaea hybrida]
MKKMYILGAGNLGCNLAFTLRSLTPPVGVVLLLRSQALQEFRGRIERTWGGVTRGVHGVEAEDSSDTTTTATKGRIENLIVATKTYQLTSALQGVRHRLDERSNVLLLQNGIPPGIDTMFPNLDPARRPRCWGAVTTHGVFRPEEKERFCFTLAGVGEVHFGPLWEETGDEGKGWFEEQIERTGGVLVGGKELRRRQVEKLAVNAAINPVTAIWGVRNGEVLGIPEAVKVMKGVVREVAAVEDVDEEVLWRKVEEVVEATKENWSSMYQDFKADRETEVREINGWVVERGREMGKRCEVNEKLVTRMREKEMVRFAIF